MPEVSSGPWVLGILLCLLGGCMWWIDWNWEGDIWHLGQPCWPAHPLSPGLASFCHKPIKTNNSMAPHAWRLYLLNTEELWRLMLFSLIYNRCLLRLILRAPWISFFNCETRTNENQWLSMALSTIKIFKTLGPQAEQTKSWERLHQMQRHLPSSNIEGFF